MANDKLTKTELKVIREAFEGEAGHDLRLTDDAISGIVLKDKEKFMEMDLEDQVALLTKAEDAFKGIAIADPGITSLVNKMDPAFNAELDACLDAIIKNTTRSMDIFAQFRRIYSKATLDACPMPGTEKKDVEGTNYKPDIVEKQAVAGGTIRTVFINDWVQATPKGKAYQATIDAMKIAEKDGTKSKKEVKSAISIATQGRNGMRTMFARALTMHHQLSAIEMMPLIKWEFIPGTADKHTLVPVKNMSEESVKVTLSPKPFWFMPVNPDTKKEIASEGREISVTQLNAFNIPKAIQNGGTLDALVKSAKGEPETPQTLGEKLSQEQFDTGLVVFNAKLSNTEERAALRKRALEKDNETLREACCALYLNLQGFYNANKKWYEERLNGQEEAVA